MTRDRGRRGFGLAFALLALTAGMAIGGAVPASAVTCNATDATGFQNKLNDNTCDTIVLAAGPYVATNSWTVNRSVTITGAGSAVGGTNLQPGAINFDVVSLPNFNVTVTLNDLSITGGSGGSGIETTNGADFDNNVVLNLNRLVIRSNSAPTGGGIQAGFYTELTAVDTAFISNTASSGGGGAIFNSGAANLTNVTFSSNSAVGDGGGLRNNTAGITSAVLTNTTFSNNRTNAGGGGIYDGSGTTIDLRNSTLSGNFADDDANGTPGDDQDGGAIRAVGTSRLQNTILGTNTDKSGDAPECDGTVTRFGYVLVRTTTGCTFGGTGDTVTGFQSGVDPLLGNLGNNGGPTQTFALLSGSPAIDKVPFGLCLTAADQRGVSRIQGTACDLGAFELAQPQPTPTATPTPTPAFDLAGAIKKCKKKFPKGPKRKKCIKKAKAKAQ
jgi:predicted outer membrane repeat protein